MPGLIFMTIGDLDAAFVQNTSKSFGVTNTIKYSERSLAGGYYVRNSNLKLRQPIYKVGMTTHLTKGKILSLFATETTKDGNKPGNSIAWFVKAENIINKMEIYPY